ncbi:MAG: universal stress protein [Deltaproteobacteria bacterium]|nr:universal stress protein [Deltaproteobacteria bacterium]
MKAVRYVDDTVNPKAVEVTLFSVLPEAPGTGLEKEPSLHPVFASKMLELKGLTEEKRKMMESVTALARKVLEEAGIPDNKVIVKIQVKKVGIARDIMLEAQEGKYNAIVVGRRGVSAIKEFMFGSISNKVVSFARNCTVWVVD